jgi:hypothetical protein
MVDNLPGPDESERCVDCGLWIRGAQDSVEYPLGFG